jgi:hypothetical protein
MNDIKLTDISNKKTDFEKKHVTQLTPVEAKTPEPTEKVKVKFEKFVQLVATHNFEDVMRDHAQDDIILSGNLLMDLASAHEEEPKEGKKLPIIFVVGVIIGIVVTYLLIRF